MSSIPRAVAPTSDDAAPPANGDDWQYLFNGRDLSGWTTHGASWSVTNGVLWNRRGRETDFINTKVISPGAEFTFEMRVLVRAGTRLRVFLGDNSFYFGNEGFTRWFQLYSDDLNQITKVSDDTYVVGRWYTMRVEVDADGHVALFRDGVLIHTAKRIRRRPLKITIQPGDGFSEGQIAISGIRVQIGKPK